MTIYYEDAGLRLWHGSNLDLLPTFEDASFDSICTDPPYELGFMGKGWDSTGIAYNVNVWRECLRVLKPGGQIALSTLGPGTYAELRDAFGRVDRHRHTLDFSVAERLVPIAEAAGFIDVSARRRTITLHYPDLRELLGAVKAIGANALGDGRRAGMMGRRAWQALSEAYEGWRTDAGLPASYDVILLTATRR